jgi:hypothetical protein
MVHGSARISPALAGALAARPAPLGPSKPRYDRANRFDPSRPLPFVPAVRPTPPSRSNPKRAGRPKRAGGQGSEDGLADHRSSRLTDLRLLNRRKPPAEIAPQPPLFRSGFRNEIRPHVAPSFCRRNPRRRELAPRAPSRAKILPRSTSLTPANRLERGPDSESPRSGSPDGENEYFPGDMRSKNEHNEHYRTL